MQVSYIAESVSFGFLYENNMNIVRQENDPGQIQTHKHRCPGVAKAC